MFMDCSIRGLCLIFGTKTNGVNVENYMLIERRRVRIYKELSMNRQIHLIIDIFGQLLFKMAIPRQKFTEV